MNKEVTPTQQDSQFLEQAFNELSQKPEADGKIKIKEQSNPYHYLPPINEALSLLGGPKNFPQVITLYEEYYKTPADLKKSSKHNLFSKGAGIKTLKQLFAWLAKLPVPYARLFSYQLLRNIVKGSIAGSNIGSWLSAIHSFELRYKETSPDPNHEFGPLFTFIKQRGNAEVAFLTQAKKKINSKALDQNNVAALWSELQHLWREHTRVPEEVLQQMTNFYDNKFSPKTATPEQTLLLLKCHYSFKFDFYLEAITSYEIGCALYFSEDKNDAHIGKSIITRAITAYATNKKIRCCFEGLLLEYEDLLTQITGKFSKHELASFIEIAEDTNIASGYSLEQKQYNQLKDWKRGKNLPGDDKLMTFIENMHEFVGGTTNSTHFYYCRIALGLDKQIKLLLKECEKEQFTQQQVLAIIKEVLANIPDYYQKNLEKQIT